MKIKNLTLAIIVIMAGTMATSCQSIQEKPKNEQDKIEEVMDNLKKAQKEALAEYKKFKQESQVKINENEKYIAEYKAKIATEKSEIKIKLEKRLMEIEQQNNILKNKLKDFNEEEIDKWKSFKTEFNNDIDYLGEAIKNFTINN
jgi:hypothetical protein